MPQLNFQGIDFSCDTMCASGLPSLEIMRQHCRQGDQHVVRGGAGRQEGNEGAREGRLSINSHPTALLQ
eukprot:1776658-Amphidinium_carterae.1